MKLHYGSYGSEFESSGFSKNFRDEIERNFAPVYTFDPAHPVVRLSEPTFSADEVIEVAAVMCSTRVTMGNKVNDFEKKFAESVGVDYCVSSNSGSSANLLAVSALCSPLLENRLLPGDEVIVPAVSWSTTVWPLIQHGLIPVVVDVDPESLNISLDSIEAAISERTRALMLVHVYGNPCDMSAIEEICARHRLYLIEDCCEALAATYGGRPVGSFGCLGTFSFYYSHHISTLEGGVTITPNFELSEIMTIRRAHGWTRDMKDPTELNRKNEPLDPRFLFVDLGYNVRITEVQGAMGLSQLKKLNSFVNRRRSNTLRFEQAIARNPRLKCQKREEKGDSSCFGFAILTGSQQERRELSKYLTMAGIENRPIICGNIARQPAMSNFSHRISGSLDNSDTVMDCGLSIGNHHGLDEAAVDYVCSKLVSF